MEGTITTICTSTIRLFYSNLLLYHPATGLYHKNVRTLAVGGKEHFAASAIFLCYADAVAVVEGGTPLRNVGANVYRKTAG